MQCRVIGRQRATSRKAVFLRIRLTSRKKSDQGNLGRHPLIESLLTPRPRRSVGHQVRSRARRRRERRSRQCPRERVKWKIVATKLSDDGIWPSRNGTPAERLTVSSNGVLGLAAVVCKAVWNIFFTRRVSQIRDHSLTDRPRPRTGEVPACPGITKCSGLYLRHSIQSVPNRDPRQFQAVA